eukprot:CAMPEP_0113940662 /NCGR_PEP_ID=MMETSP1339-20121228/6746_1 /TAXON_ID=94617 /ORGANISM="Fibrocapsa japonica" /LENGTH=150 /DNA_ID=CAMNT_0000944563 /DNA_START=124 /DNA_END=576 /DNA_ORIENTATION=+ /assembly_acc=CAM_ASM_000762
MDIEVINGAKSFSSLLDASKAFTLLYFAASWCPDCVQFGPSLAKFMEQIDLSKQVQVVLVSSDRDEEAMMAHLKSFPGMLAVGYNDPARQELKRELGICAAKEVGELQVTRKGGIPTVIVLNKDFCRVTDAGAQDIEQLGASAVSKWNQI